MRGMQSVQPQYPARVAEPWARVFQSVYNPGDGDGFRDLLGNNHLTAGTGTGELTRAVDMRGRRAFKGTNGANGYARKNGVVAALTYPVVLVTVASYATTASKTCASFGIGGAAIGAPNSKFIHTGNTASNNSFCYEFNGGRATAMTRISGTAYGASSLNVPRCSVSISRSATEHYLWVDGVEYSSTANAGAIDDTPHNIGLGALATASAVITYPIEGNVALAAFGYGVDPGNDALQALSLNPWQMFAPRPRRRLVAAPVPATGVTMSGPSSGTTGVASSNFTIGVTPSGGPITGTVVVTPADGGAGGTFTPTTVSLTTGSPTATFTYTPASTGAKTISVTNDGGLTNPSNITYTSNAASVAGIGAQVSRRSNSGINFSGNKR